MRTSTRHLVYTFLVLFAINTVNFFDRQILGAVQESLKRDTGDAWQLSDGRLGALGTAFILLYAVVGLPLGHLADVWRRKWLLALGVAVWSLFTLASGFAWSFGSLFVFRLGVGVGEASCAPAASSLIGDLVDPRSRARAMAVFMLGLPVGLALSFLVSSTIAQRYDWRTAFLVAGVPGFALAALVLFVADPPRRAAPAATPRPPLPAVVRRILGRPTMLWIIASGALHNFNMYALGNWLGSLVERYHGVSTERAGQVGALVYGCGAFGITAAGWLGDRAYAHSVRGRLTVAWVGVLIAAPCLVLGLAASPGDVWVCAAWLLLGAILMYAYYGTVYATIQDVVEPELRGIAMAVYFCAMYLFGGFAGPVATGWLSDHFARAAAAGGPIEPIHRATGLHDAMYVIPAVNVALAVVLFCASRTVKADVERLSAEPRSQP